LPFLNRLSVLRLRPRSLWRDQASYSPEEIRRTERWLATARVFLAISALLAIWMDPGEVRSLWAYALLMFYIFQGTAIILLLRSRQQSTSSFRLLVHGADVIWPALISLFTTGQSNPFFLFFLFVLAAAAYRWGLWETVVTAACSVALLWVESLSVKEGVLQSVNIWFAHHHLPIIRPDATDLEPKRLIMRSGYLIVMGLLLGYLSERQKKLRAEKDVVARMLGLVSMESGLAGTLSQIAANLLNVYSAQAILVASHESGNPRLSVGVLDSRNPVVEMQWIDPGSSASETYLKDSTLASWHATSDSTGRELTLTAFDAAGTRVRDANLSVIRRFAQIHRFQTACAISFSFGQELAGRIFLLEPKFTSPVEEELLFLQELVRQVSPAIYNLYLVRRLRSRAGALERARLVRELHDGAVQSLIGVEMQVDVLRRNYPTAGADPAGERSGFMGRELERIQNLLREEVLKLRELMQQMKSVEVDARRLPAFLRDTVQRFQRETGITASFLMDADEVVLPSAVCRELARIAQEALVNVRKHSGAKQVAVQLVESEGKWELVIEDDGSGFPFAGRVSQADLDSSGRAPAIIRERVRLIHGELTIESNPGRGSRVEVKVSQPQQAAYG
jgi:signal transduction histidine kinase